MMIQKGELCIKNLCLGCVLYLNPTLNPPMNMEHAQVSQEDEEKSDGMSNTALKLIVGSYIWQSRTMNKKVE